MFLFRLADVPRTVRRLTPPLPLLPDAAGPDADDALRRARVEWTLCPTLLSRGSARLRARIDAVIALYEGAEGQPRSSVDALAPQIEELLNDYRLARCVARTIEGMGYHYASPPHALPLEPAALRALCYRRAQERYHGYVPRARRAAFLTELAAEVGAAVAQVEETLWADRPGAALLRSGPAPDSDAGSPHERVTAESLRPTRVIALYNASAVATLLAASSWVTLSLPAAETAAIKSLYRHAKARHVGVDIAAPAPMPAQDAAQREQTAEIFAVTLYGPGSRALVRGRHAIAPDPAAVRASTEASVGDDATSLQGETHGDPDGLDAASGGVTVPAPGGLPVAAVVARVAQRHPAAVQEGWMRLLVPDRRLFHVPLDAAALAALRHEPASDGDDEIESGQESGQETADSGYDSAVEAGFARAFRAAEAGGRLGIARGWMVEREPRAVIVAGSVFLPDFSFRRGDVEVLCEIVGFYTEDYLARKRRKLAHLRGQISLLLVVDQERAPLFSECGFPMVTYRAGRQVSVTDVAHALDAAFDPFTRRRAGALDALAALCALPGPRLDEEELCAAIGCAGRDELTRLWSDLLVQPPLTGSAVGDGGDGGSRGIGGDAMGRLQRCYVPGYGLARADAIAAAHTALTSLLDESGGAVALDEALACCAQAGLPAPDEALIAQLGGIVVRSDLFGAAQVHRPGADADRALTAALSPRPPSRHRRS